MNKKIIMPVIIIICIIIVAFIAYHFISIYIIEHPKNKYVLGEEVIVADNTEEDEERYDEYIYNYNISNVNTEITEFELYIYSADGIPKKLSDLPLPRKIIYYHKGVPYVFKYGSEYYNEIIEINNRRDTGNVSTHMYFTMLHGPVSDLILNIDILEYYYDEEDSTYFNLDEYWFMGKKYKIYWADNYVGLSNATELRSFLNSIIQKY